MPKRPDPVARVRKLCLGLPEATEKQAWGRPTFRVRGKKMFAMYMNDHHGDGRVALWLNAPPEAQDAVVESDPERFFRAALYGTERLDRRAPRSQTRLEGDSQAGRRGLPPGRAEDVDRAARGVRPTRS